MIHAVPAPRQARPGDFPVLAALWHSAWHEAHDALVPAGLIALRTPESFAARIGGFCDLLRVAGPQDAVQGLCTIKKDEIDQMFVASAARGTGLAAALPEDGEARLYRAGSRVAHLSVVPENVRALRFYERHGWARHATRDVVLAGPFRLRSLILRKSLTPPHD